MAPDPPMTLEEKREHLAWLIANGDSSHLLYIDTLKKEILAQEDAGGQDD